MGEPDDERPPLVLTVAGTDPSGGAGIPVDLQVFRDHGAHGLSVVTAVVWQNTSEVRGFEPVDSALVGDQFEAVADDLPVDAVKIGMVATVENAEEIAVRLETLPAGVDVVFDPVLAGGGSGRSLSKSGLADAFRRTLVPRVDWLTPNAPEAETLCGGRIDGPDALLDAAERLRGLGADRVLAKGGHLDESSDEVVDGYAGPEGAQLLEPLPRLPVDVRGTGCQLSSALAAMSAESDEGRELAERARAYLAELIRDRRCRIGEGRPVVVRGSTDRTSTNQEREEN